MDEALAGRLEHMASAIANIERITSGRSMEDYRSDRDFAAALERYIEIISEASRHIPPALKSRHPEIDWRGIAGIGNVIRHAYDRIDAGKIWSVVEVYLGSLKTAIVAMRAASPPTR